MHVPAPHACKACNHPETSPGRSNVIAMWLDDPQVPDATPGVRGVSGTQEAIRRRAASYHFLPETLYGDSCYLPYSDGKRSSTCRKILSFGLTACETRMRLVHIGTCWCRAPGSSRLDGRRRGRIRGGGWSASSSTTPISRCARLGDMARPDL